MVSTAESPEEEEEEEESLIVAGQRKQVRIDEPLVPCRTRELVREIEINHTFY